MKDHAAIAVNAAIKAAMPPGYSLNQIQEKPDGTYHAIIVKGDRHDRFSYTFGTGEDPGSATLSAARKIRND